MRIATLTLLLLAGCGDGTLDTGADPDAGVRADAQADGRALGTDALAPDGAHDGAAADLARPDAAAGAPDAGRADATDLDATDRDAVDLDAAERDAAERDAIEPDASEPDAAEPDAFERPPTPAPGPNDSWRYGGGVGYPDRVPRAAATAVVRDADGLEGALAQAAPGDIVYVADDARVDLTGRPLCVPAGVTLASGRGRTAGALLYTTAEARPLIRVCGDDVRITGLRIQGADPQQCPPEHPGACPGVDRTGGANCRDCTPSHIGIQARGFDRLEVDNNEISGWSYAGVWVTDSVDDVVRYNHIHHTQRQGLGYGVVLTRGGDDLVTVDIHHNRFDFNRHAVAGSGEPGQDYDAHHNLVLEHANGHVFDMHGHNENTDNGSPLAGGDVRVHANTVLVDDAYTMVIRGRPDHGAWLYDNCLARGNAGAAALQRFFFGNFHVDAGPDGRAPNRYGQRAGDCEPVRWCVAGRGDRPWRYLARTGQGVDALRFADLDGDGRTDVFRTRDGVWEWSRSGTASWARRNASGAALADLAFADFDGDGRDDVFWANGRQWQVSDGGASPWRPLRDAPERVADLRFGDFDGDGRADVFTTADGEWRWSRSGQAAWARRNRSAVGLADLGFADFDGDGATDVFRANGARWEISRGGASPWAELGRSSDRLAALRFADLDGDGRADVLRANADGWFVAAGGTGRWQHLRVTHLPLAALRFGDFDGDGADDVFRGGCR